MGMTLFKVLSRERRLRRRTAGERGGIFVELAISIPILLLLVSGIIDIGLGLNEYSARLNATRMAARRIARISHSELNTSDFALASDDLTSFAEQAMEYFFTQSNLKWNDYTLSVRPRTVDGKVGIQLIVRRNTALAFFLPRNAIKACVSVVFQLENWKEVGQGPPIAPTPKGPDDDC